MSRDQPSLGPAVALTPPLLNSISAASSRLKEVEWLLFNLHRNYVRNDQRYISSSSNTDDASLSLTCQRISWTLWTSFWFRARTLEAIYRGISVEEHRPSRGALCLCAPSQLWKSITHVRLYKLEQAWMTHHHEHRDSRDLWIQTGRNQHKLEKHHTCKHLLIYKVVMQKKCNLEKH